MGDVTASYRAGLVVACFFVFLAGWWAYNHPDDTPRFSGGYGSGMSPGTRKFWGGVATLLALGVAVLTVVL